VLLIGAIWKERAKRVPFLGVGDESILFFSFFCSSSSTSPKEGFLDSFSPDRVASCSRGIAVEQPPP
jgi:hypothetical protein